MRTDEEQVVDKSCRLKRVELDSGQGLEASRVAFTAVLALFLVLF